MDAALRVFKRVAGLSDGDPGAVAAGAAFCSLRLLVASSQAIHLIGKQGSTIKSIQERSGASLRVLSEGELFVFTDLFAFSSECLVHSRIFMILCVK